MGKRSGKTLMIFLVLIAIILISLTAISVFLFVKQLQLRETAEQNLEQVQASETALRVELDAIKKQKNILDERMKEAEVKIESLLGELDMAEGIRDEIKKENRELKDALAALEEKNKQIKTQLEEKEQEADQRVSDLQQQLTIASERNKTLEEKRLELEQEYNVLKSQLSKGEAGGYVQEEGVDLEKIVVSGVDKEGQIVSIDREADFVIVNLGERQGVAAASTLSVFNGDQYLGDILVTKVLPEMAAADFIDPLTSQQVSEGNLVKVKQGN